MAAVRTHELDPDFAMNTNTSDDQISGATITVFHSLLWTLGANKSSTRPTNMGMWCNVSRKRVNWGAERSDGSKGI